MFRLLSRDDFSRWTELFEEPEAGRFLGLEDLPTPRERCQKWFAFTENRYNNGLGGMNVLIDKQTNQLIGQCGLLVQEVDKQIELEVAYSILPRFWNQGYATEAARRCRDCAFRFGWTDSLVSVIHVENVYAARVAKNMGMKQGKETVFRQMPVHVFRIEKKEWAERNYTNRKATR